MMEKNQKCFTKGGLHQINDISQGQFYFEDDYYNSLYGKMYGKNQKSFSMSLRTFSKRFGLDLISCDIAELVIVIQKNSNILFLNITKYCIQSDPSGFSYAIEGHTKIDKAKKINFQAEGPLSLLVGNCFQTLSDEELIQKLKEIEEEKFNILM